MYIISTTEDGLVANMYGCRSGGPGFESRVASSLVIETFCLKSLSNSSELSCRCVTPVLQRARKAINFVYDLLPVVSNYRPTETLS